MKVNRREFIKISAALGSLAVLADLLYKEPLTTFAESLGKAEETEAAEDVWLPSICVNCVNFCGIKVHRVNGVVVRVEGDPDHPFNLGKLCPKGNAGVMQLYHPYRLKVPLKRTNPEKGIGVDPKWIEISWDEAYNTAAEKIAAARGNPIIWIQGHGKYVMHKYFMKAIVKSLKTKNKIHRGSVCEASRHVSDELTWGGHGFLPDLDYCNYLIVFGSAIVSGEQWNRWLERKVIFAKERGMKLVVVDPRLSRIAAKADEWIPIKPTTDGAFLLAMAHVLIKGGMYDSAFLKAYTNAPFLVGPDGYFLRDEAEKELVWDEDAGGTVAYETATKPALTGTYSVDGVEYKPAFQVFSDEVEDYTPEWASEITGVPAETITRISEEFGEAAKMGSTIMLEGHTLRYTPVNIHTFRGLSMHQYGAQTNRARWMVCLLVGNLGAVGGVHLHKPTAPTMGKLTWPPTYADLQKSLLYPFAAHNITQQLALTLLDPDKYELPYKPEVSIVYASNRVASAPDPKAQVDGHSKLFQISIDIHMSEQTELADIVIPDRTYLESCHWAYQRWTLDADSYAVRQPIVNVYNLPQALSSIIEIIERAGFLYGEGGLNDAMNDELGLKDPYKLELGKRYSVEEILDRLCLTKTKGEKGLDWFKEHGFYVKPMTVEKKYLHEFPEVFGPGSPENLRTAFYAENIVKALDGAKKKWAEMGKTLEDVKEKYGVKYEGYDPLPKYHEVDGFKVSPTYDLYLISYKSIFHTQTSITSPNMLLRELEDENYAVMNSEAAKARGIEDGDWVWVESTFNKVKVKAKVIEGIHPEVVAISYHFGHWANISPQAKGKGVNPNFLMPVVTDEIGGQAAFSGFKVKVYRE